MYFFSNGVMGVAKKGHRDQQRRHEVQKSKKKKKLVARLTTEDVVAL